MSDLSEVKIFSGENSKYIAEKIAKSIGSNLGQKAFLHFSDGEFATAYDETVRGDHVFIVQSTFPPSDNLMELLMMIDAAKRASAYKVIAVIPYFGMLVTQIAKHFLMRCQKSASPEIRLSPRLMKK